MVGKSSEQTDHQRSVVNKKLAIGLGLLALAIYIGFLWVNF